MTLFVPINAFSNPDVESNVPTFMTNCIAEESLETGGPNFAEILNKALPDSDHSSCDSHSDRSSNSGEVSKVKLCVLSSLNCLFVLSLLI